MGNKFGPCLEKKCSVCCNPVKVNRDFSDEKIPVDENGGKIWVDREEILIPEEHIDTVRLRTFDCTKFDKTTGKCAVHDSRPDICRNTSCIDEELSGTVDEQHHRFASQKFISIKK